MRCSHNSSSVLLYSKIYERFSGANLNIFYLFKKMTYRCLFNCSPQNSMWQSAVAKGFAEVDSVFIVITSAKILPRWLFPSKIYIQFTIFNIYVMTKLLFTKERYHLHVLKKHLYLLQEVRSIIYFQQFIHPLSLCSCGNGTSFAFMSYILLSV